MKRIVLLYFTISSLTLISAQHSGGGEGYPNLHTNMEALQKFQDMRFGMFIHWGPVTLRGTEISWSRGKQVPIEEYDNLYREFNPVLFNATDWVASAKAAGMKYIVFTSKHHDGFCLWDSEFTDYDIMSTDFKRDIIKELAMECKKQGISLSFYYSIADWKHPHYATRYGGDSRPIENSDMSIYFQYMKSQLKELIENYDPDILWFDGEWENAYSHEMGMDLYAYLRELKGDLLINNRVDKGRTGMAGMTKNSTFAGDFGTPEQEIGAFDRENPWETCMTIATQWAWKANDKIKSKKECIRTLVQTVGGDGNLLFNVGPMADGRIEQRQINRIKEMGEWLKINGQAIYETRGGPYLPTDYMVSTQKENKIYLHLMKHPGKIMELPFAQDLKFKKAYFLDGDKSVEVNQKKNSLDIKLPETLPDVIVSVLVLEFDRSTSDIGLIKRFNY